MKQIKLTGKILPLVGAALLLGTSLTLSRTARAIENTKIPATIGQPAPGFILPNVKTGAMTSSVSLRHGKKATVVMFISAHCPVSNAYNDRMAALAAKYEARGVSFVGINANQNEKQSEIASHAANHKFPFPVLKDSKDIVADAYNAHVTPETYVIDSSGFLVYHGRIDNSQDPAGVQTHELADALNNVLAGKPVAKAETRAFGCGIRRAR